MRRILEIATALAVLLCCIVSTGAPAAADEVTVKGDFILPIDRITEEQDIPDGFVAVYDASDLQKIVDNPDGKYILMADISLAEFGGLHSIGFTGVLYGNGYSLTDMYTEGFAHPRYELRMGLFAGYAMLKYVICACRAVCIWETAASRAARHIWAELPDMYLATA